MLNQKSIIKPLLIQSLLCAFITFSYAKDINKQFAEKYLQNVKIYKQEINNSGMLNKLKSSTSSFHLKIHFDKNESKRYLEGVHFVKSKNAKNEANEVNNIINSQKFNQNVKGMKEYILSDKGFNYQAYLGKYKKLADEVIKGKYSQNNFLSDKEKIYVVISSSIPKSTLQNYFLSVQPVRTDVVFVIRGLVGNNLKYFMPTFKWIRSVTKKPNCDDTKRNDCYYKVNIELNPKVTEHFNIKEVPAVIFVKNYNGFLDKYAPLPKKTDEETYIAYGDCSLSYALEEINKKAKDKYLAKLIKRMNGGFFDK